MNLWRSLLCVAVVLGLGAVAADANNNNRNKTNNRNNPQAPDRGEVNRLSTELNKARADLNKAIAARDGIATKIRNSMRESQEYKDAEGACRTTDAELKAAKTPVIESLANQPAYQAATKQKTQAEAARDKFNDATPEKVSAAQAVMEAAASVTKIETEAFKADAKVTEAQAAHIDALKRFDEIKKQIEANLRNDSEWQTASKAATDAQANIAKLDKEHDSAMAKFHQQEQAYRNQLAQQQNKNNRNNNNRNTNNRNTRNHR